MCDSKVNFLLGSDLCPVKLFKIYIAKLNPKRNDLWQKPKKDVLITDEVWFDNVPVGPHPLSNFMKTLSESAKLSKIYTNHCIRSTCITSLDESGFEARHITAVSGHKSETTIKNYSVKCPEKKKMEMSDALSMKLMPKNMGKHNPPQKIATSTVSSVNEQNSGLLDWIPIENNEEDFDLGQIIDQVDRYENQVLQENQIVQQQDTVLNPPPLQEIKIPNQNLVQNITHNQANQYPFLPKMIFPHSNVTINYNFSNK